MPPLSEKELEEYRYLFPVTKKHIYFNHAGVAPISLRVADAVNLYNQDSLHNGYTAAAAWEKHFSVVRRDCATLIGAEPQEVAFVKSTSHGISLVAGGLNLQAGDEVILSESEFPSNVYPWMAQEKRGIRLKKIPEENGELRIDRLDDLVTPRTKVVALSWVQYGSGYRLPLEKVGAWCRDRGIYFFVDAIQGLGAFPLDVQKAKIDFLAADAHKWILGHEGIGIFYARKDLIPQIEPLLLGWNSVENPWDFDHYDFRLAEDARRFEEGSPNGLSIYGLGAAVRLLLEIGVARISERVLALTDQLQKAMLALGMLPRHSQNPEHRSGIVSFNFPSSEASNNLAELHRHLLKEKIFCSVRRGGLRFSPHFYNSEAEIQKTADAVRDFLQAH